MFVGHLGVVLALLASVCSKTNVLKKVEEKFCGDAKTKHCPRDLKILRYSQKYKDLICCLTNRLTSNKKDYSSWAYLAESIEILEPSSSLGSSCYSEAKSLAGIVSPVIKEWDFIGPFCIGKLEVDGDPLATYGGIHAAHRRFILEKPKYLSELSPDGIVKWKKLSADENGAVIISPKIDWNDLVTALGSLGIMEWQGWIVGEFSVHRTGQILIQCPGFHTVYVDGQILASDIYRRPQFWFSVELSSGIHNLTVHVRAKVQMSMRCQFKSGSSLRYELLTPSFVPDLVQGRLAGRHIPLPIVNHMSGKWIKDIRARFLGQSHGLSAKIDGTLSVAPGQVSTIPILLSDTNEGSAKRRCRQGLDYEIEISASGFTSKSIGLQLRCREKHESFIFTFSDHDGSIQHAAAISPRSKQCPSSGCPVLISLHGTGVPAQNQADSYKQMKNKKWLFGYDSAWVLAPTRHGAHNWEGPGMLTALESLEALRRMSEVTSWLPLADISRVVFAGHSMGGHGAWQLATHFPDQALGLIVGAGWISKEEYGDSNLFFEHDVAASFTDPSVKGILEASVAENRADFHVKNLENVPVLARIGAADRTVHPFFMRRMYRLLNESGANITYAELPGKEHWWWDTLAENDGGVNNDRAVRDFVARVLQRNDDESSKASHCHSGDCGSNDGDESSADMWGRKLRSYTLIVVNPASHGSLRGLKVLAQDVPMRMSRVEMGIGVGEAIISTWNVRMLSVEGTNWVALKIDIDGFVFEPSQDLCYVKTDKGEWTKCQNELLPLIATRYGPARRVAEAPFMIVLGNSKSSALLNYAVYIANLFHLTSDTRTQIVKHTEVDNSTLENFNLILLGQPEEHPLLARLLGELPIKFGEGVFEFGHCKFGRDSDSVGLSALAIHASRRMALILTGNTPQAINDVVHLATPTIPPMTRSPFSNLVPDFLFIGPDFQSTGSGSYLCAGYWDHVWTSRGYQVALNRQSMSCPC